MLQLRAFRKTMRLQSGSLKLRFFFCSKGLPEIRKFTFFTFLNSLLGLLQGPVDVLSWPTLVALWFKKPSIPFPTPQRAMALLKPAPRVQQELKVALERWP